MLKPIEASPIPWTRRSIGDKRLHLAMKLIDEEVSLVVLARTLGFLTHSQAAQYLKKHNLYDAWKRARRARRKRAKRPIASRIKSANKKRAMLFRRTLHAARRNKLSITVGRTQRRCRIERMRVSVHLPKRTGVHSFNGKRFYNVVAPRNDVFRAIYLPEGGRAFIVPGEPRPINGRAARKIYEENFSVMEPWPSRTKLRRAARRIRKLQRTGALRF